MENKYRVYTFARPAGNGWVVPVIRNTEESRQVLLSEPAALAFGNTREEAAGRAKVIAAALNS